MKKNKRIPILSLIGVLAVVAAFTGVLFSGLPITATAVDVSEINTPYPYNQAEFDNYTDSDLLYPPASGQAGLGINDYKGQLLATGSAAEYGQEHDMIVSISSDDPIIRIIPRRLFERRGTYLHIGREYGFYVETTQLDDTNIYENKSVVLVFDIIKYPLNNGNYPSQYAIEIKPVFEYTYYYLTDNNNFASDNDDLKYNAASLSSAVVAVPVVEWLDNSLVYYYRETKTHFLKDMSFGLSLYNEQELNIGDGGYDKNADNGSFITRANVNFSGVSNQALLGSSVLSTFKFGLGFIKYVGDVISIAEYGYELFTNEANDFRGNVGYGDYYNTQYYNSKAEQLAHYANLNKSAVVELLSDDPRPLLFGRTQENNYVRGVFTLGMTEDWYTRTIDTVKLSVVTESTNWFTGNSDITSRTTAERSARGNIRTLQGKPITLESAKSFTLLPNGITKFDFAAEYASDYTLDITNGSQMSVKIDNAAVSFSGNQTTKALSAGTHEIEIQGNNASKLTSSISVAPKTIAASTANTSITIPAYANYAVKITSLAQVKALSTNISSVVIKAIFTNNSWSNYVLYGAISPTSKLTHPFVPGNYYALLENKTASSIAIPFTIAEPSSLSSSLPITMDGANYTYVKFTAPEEATYAITLSNMSGASFIVRKNDLMLTSTGGGYFPGYFYKIDFNAGSTYYIGIRNGQTTGNTVRINKAGAAYQWQISGGAGATTAEEVYSLARNATYALSLLVNGVRMPNVIFEYSNQATQFGSYLFDNPANNQIRLSADTPIGGNGIRVYAWVSDSNGQSMNIDRLDIIPQFESAARITGMTNGSDMQFSYSVPRFVTGFDYQIFPSTKTFTFYLSANLAARINKANALGGNQGTVSFLGNYNTLGYTTMQALYINIVKLYYIDVINGEQSAVKYISSSYPMNNFFGGGSGTSASPFIISTLRHFNNIANTCNNSAYYYKQTVDLNFNNTAHSLQTKSFWGTYDGGHYSLNDIYLSIPSTQYGEIGGFCGRSCGTIKNVNIKNLYLFVANPSDHDDESGAIYVGGVSGLNQGLLYNVDLYSSQVLVHRMRSYVGGITGYNFGIQGAYYYTIGSRNYNLYCCNFGWYSTTQVSKVHSNGNIGGIAGYNAGNLYYCLTNSKTIVMLYQIEANNKSLGGIVGYNYNGYVVYCNNYADVAYDPDTPKSSNKDIAPRIGKIAGTNYGSYNLIGSECGGTISSGSLQLYIGFFGAGAYNQLKYVGAYCTQGIGLNYG